MNLSRGCCSTTQVDVDRTASGEAAGVSRFRGYSYGRLGAKLLVSLKEGQRSDRIPGKEQVGHRMTAFESSPDFTQRA